MALRAKDEASPRELIPARSYFARVHAIIDLGVQESLKYAADHKVLFLFELHTRKGPALDKEGRPLVANREFALKFSKIPGRTPAGLRLAVEALEGREIPEHEAREGVDLEQYLGRPCKVVIKHNTRDGKTYDNLDAILPLDEDDDAPEAQLDDLYYELDPSAPIPDAVPKWIARKIQASREWVAVHGAPEGRDGTRPAQPVGARTYGPPSAGDDDDGIPF